MAARSPSVHRAVMAVARATKLGESAETIAERQRDLRAAKLADYVARIVAEAPPLTAEQRDRISALLNGRQ